MSIEGNENETVPRKKGKGFFALDVNQFERIRGMNLGIAEAAAYLCLLKSTDQSNVTSVGGINSIHEYTGLTRAEAKKAVDRLEKAGLLYRHEVTRPRAKTVPRYSLPIQDKRRPLATKEQPVVDAIAAGRQPEGKVEMNAAQRAQEKGYIERGPDGWRLVEYVNEVAFIPNSFVSVSNGNSPLRRLVRHGELGPIMLAAELYQMQNLMDERGVPTSALRAYYYASSGSRAESRVGQQHRLHRLWPGRKFKDADTGEDKLMRASCEPSRFRDYEQVRFWPDLEALEGAHIVEWAVYSANGKPSGKYTFNRPQRPLGALRNGKQALNAPESIPSFAAYLVSRLQNFEDVLSRDPEKIIGEWQESSSIISLENQSVEHVEGVGILRMTHLADTENTRVWYRDTRAECRETLFFIEQIARASFPQVVEIIQSLQAHGSMGGDISMYLKGSSTHDQ